MKIRKRLFIITICLCVGVLTAASSKPDFSGRWRLDPSGSSKDAPAALTENVDHREPLIRIDTEWDRSRATGLGNAAMLAPSLELKSDGTESSNKLPMDLALTTKSHWDGDKLVTEWHLTGLHEPMNGTWTRYLTGPNSMVVDSVAASSGRKITARFVFVK